MKKPKWINSIIEIITMDIQDYSQILDKKPNTDEPLEYLYAFQNIKMWYSPTMHYVVILGLEQNDFQWLLEEIRQAQQERDKALSGFLKSLAKIDWNNPQFRQKAQLKWDLIQLMEKHKKCIEIFLK